MPSNVFFWGVSHLIALEILLIRSQQLFELEHSLFVLLSDMVILPVDVVDPGRAGRMVILLWTAGGRSRWL